MRAPGDSSRPRPPAPLISTLPAFHPARARLNPHTVHSSRLRVSRERREAYVRCPVLKPGWSLSLAASVGAAASLSLSAVSVLPVRAIEHVSADAPGGMALGMTVISSAYTREHGG